MAYQVGYHIFRLMQIDEFILYLNYCRGLKFEEKPDYNYLRKLFKELFVKEAFEFDYVYDWILLPMTVKYPNLRGRFPINMDLNIDDDEDDLVDFDEEEEKSILAEDPAHGPADPFMNIKTPGAQDLNKLYKEHEVDTTSKHVTPWTVARKPED